MAKIFLLIIFLEINIFNKRYYSLDGKLSGGNFWDGAADGFIIGLEIGFAVGGTWEYSHFVLQNAGKMAVRVKTSFLVPNPTNHMADDGISYRTRTLS